MADNKQKAGAQDRARINVHEDYELRDWSKKFGVTPEQLEAAVARETLQNSVPIRIA